MSAEEVGKHVADHCNGYQLLLAETVRNKGKARRMVQKAKGNLSLHSMSCLSMS